MERWAIQNKTTGTLEIKCVRREPLRALERYEFDGVCPDDLKWFVGTGQVVLTQIVVEPVAPPKPPRPQERQAEKIDAQPQKTPKPDNK